MEVDNKSATNEVICLDSDDEELPLDNGLNTKSCLQECINSDCQRTSNEEYSECPTSILSMFNVKWTPNKTKYICSTCYQKALKTYAQLCIHALNNEPSVEQQTLRKIDEIDGEIERKETSKSEMIVFNAQTEKELEEIIIKITSNKDVKLQYEAQKELDERCEKNDEEIKELSELLKNLEQKSNKMCNDLHSQSLPSSLKLTGKKIIEDEICFAARMPGMKIPQWMGCKILQEVSTPKGKNFKVQFNDMYEKREQIISGKQVSYASSSDKLDVGTRVIALFPQPLKENEADDVVLQKYMPGVIAEKLMEHNRRRYLVFCDYGHVKYCEVNEVKAIRESSEFVWDDVHVNLKKFIQEYLSYNSSSNRLRPLINVRVNSHISVERDGCWRKALVKEVDCSLVHLSYVKGNFNECLYRGSQRLYAMFEYVNAHSDSTNTFRRRNDPAISFIDIDYEHSREGKKNTARKSANKQLSQVKSQVTTSSNDNQRVISLNDSKAYKIDPANVTTIQQFKPKNNINSKKYTPHRCSIWCIPPLKNDLSIFVPLAKPLLTCWERQILKQMNGDSLVVYKAPCGRRFRNISEIFEFLKKTECFLEIDNFDFDPNIKVLASLWVDKEKCPLFIPDIANGKEGMKIPCINAFDDQKPPPLEYSSERIPMKGVIINTDPEFMSCCDCTDDCSDKSRCACQQLTIQGGKYNNVMEEDPNDISYVFKRLLTTVQTGIYECNSRCKCSKRCLNKVVQHPIKVRMQLYRTKRSGWGVQSMSDIPKGSFICIYAGYLYTENDANALCEGDHDDEYFAALDFIEYGGKHKDEYESGVINPDDDSESDDESDSENENCSLKEHDNIKSDLSNGMVNVMPNACRKRKKFSIRKLYGDKEKTYILDAKICGNIGRYFNHSCDPNLFVQSVFVDTHDLRFPWLALFAARTIKAGEELCWDYNYEVGSVPSKVLYCYCGAKNCSGRIL